MFARKLTEEELKPPSSIGGGKVEDRSSMPLEATVFAPGSDEPRTKEPLGTMTGGPVTTGPPLGSADAEVVQKRTSPRRSSSRISAASHRTRDAKWDWLDKRTKIDTDMRLRKLGITNS